MAAQKKQLAETLLNKLGPQVEQKEQAVAAAEAKVKADVQSGDAGKAEVDSGLDSAAQAAPSEGKAGRSCTSARQG